MPIYEYQCNTCQRVEERFFGSQVEVQKYEQIPQPCKPNPGARASGIGKCAGRLHRKPSAAAFTVGGFSAKNGYSGKMHGEGTGVD